MSDDVEIDDVSEEVTSEEETSEEETSEEDETSEETSEEDETSEEETEETSEEDEEESEEKPDEEEEEEEELEASGNRPGFAELKKAFPDLKKKFPGVFEALGAERGYRAVFPQVKDAQAAAQRLQGVDVLEDSIMRGEPGLLLGQLKQTNPESYARFVENIPEVLAKGDKEAYSKVAKPIFAGILKSIQEIALKRPAGDKMAENLVKACKLISIQAFGDVNIPDLTKKVNPEEIRSRQERQRFIEQQVGSFDQDVDRRIGTRLYKISEASLKDVKLNPISRKHVATEIANMVDDILDSDPVFNSSIRNLRSRAFRAGLTEEFKSRLTRAYMERAQQVLPGVRKKVLALIRTSGEGKPVVKRPSKEQTSRRVENSQKPRSGGLEEQMKVLQG